MATITLNPILATDFRFVCNVAINWAVGRKRAGIVTVSDNGSTAAIPAKASGVIAGGSLALGDLLEWGVDVFGPAGAKTPYTLQVFVEQAGVTVAHTTQTGTVDPGAVQTNHGLWTVA